MVTYESDWKKTEKLLKKIIDTHQYSFHHGQNYEDGKTDIENTQTIMKYSMEWEGMKPITVVSAEDSGILIQIKYAVAPKDIPAS